MYKKNNLAISSWAEEDKPREKFMKWGKSSVTNTDLLSIIIGSGNAQLNAMQIAKQILEKYNLHQLATISVHDLTNFTGIGPAKATNIMAAIEFGKRIALEVPKDSVKITASRDAYNVFRTSLQDLPHEEFWVMLLNRGNKVISVDRISIGGISATVADPRLIISKAINQKASSIILAHNHPSGTLKPSQSDIELTSKLKKAAAFFDMQIFDHLIICSNDYYSFVDDGMLF